MVGIVVQDIRSPYFADLTWELQCTADRNDLQTILMQSDWTDARMLHCICQLHSASADGIIFLGGVSRKALRQAGIPDAYPLIQIDDAVDTGYDSVGFDYRPGMDEAFRCLLENGHRRLAFVHDPVQQMKYDSYCESCRKYGVPLREFRYLSPTAAGEDAVISAAMRSPERRGSSMRSSSPPITTQRSFCRGWPSGTSGFPGTFRLSPLTTRCSAGSARRRSVPSRSTAGNWPRRLSAASWHG